MPEGLRLIWGSVYWKWGWTIGFTFDQISPVSDHFRSLDITYVDPTWIIMLPWWIVFLLWTALVALVWVWTSRWKPHRPRPIETAGVPDRRKLTAPQRYLRGFVLFGLVAIIGTATATQFRYCTLAMGSLTTFLERDGVRIYVEDHSRWGVRSGDSRDFGAPTIETFIQGPLVDRVNMSAQWFVFLPWWFVCLPGVIVTRLVWRWTRRG